VGPEEESQESSKARRELRSGHVFDDPHALGVPEHTEEGEERWKTVGMAAGVVPLLVVHTHREEGGEEYIRIISARKATPRERKAYEEGL